MKKEWIKPDFKNLALENTNVAPYDDKPCAGKGPNKGGICKYYTTANQDYGQMCPFAVDNNKPGHDNGSYRCQAPDVIETVS